MSIVSCDWKLRVILIYDYIFVNTAILPVITVFSIQNSIFLIKSLNMKYS